MRMVSGSAEGVSGDGFEVLDRKGSEKKLSECWILQRVLETWEISVAVGY